MSAEVDWSTYSGASLWIGNVVLDFTGLPSSTGSPITFRILPNISGPTGTVIGAPVWTTSIPRTRPSVLSIAMVLTSFSPRCCATSKISFCPLLSTWRASNIWGRSESNSTSTTAPITWDILPFCLVDGFFAITFLHIYIIRLLHLI